MSKKLHLICGVCGSAEELSFEIKLAYDMDENDNPTNAVIIRCRNCSTLTTLDEHIEEHGNET